jgi:hypothetical protein
MTPEGGKIMSADLIKSDVSFSVKRLFYMLAALWPVIFLFGCIQDHTVVYVKTDGSGTIEETVLMANTMFDVMKSLEAGLKGLNKEAKDPSDNDTPNGDRKPEKEVKKIVDDLIAEMSKDAEKKTTQFGSQVKLVSVTPVKTDSANGYKAVYEFQDIGQVRINQHPGENADKRAERGTPANGEEFIYFTFTKGSPAKLVVAFPNSQNDVGKEQEVTKNNEPLEKKDDKETEEATIEMMKTLFKDMKLSIKLQFDGVIVKTNAAYREGSTITLMDMDFVKIAGNVALLKQMSAAKPNSIEEMKPLLKSIPGLKIEYNNPVIVEYQ